MRMAYVLISIIIISLTGIIIFGKRNFHNRYLKDVNSCLQTNNKFENSVLTEEDIKDLPVSVKKYIQYSGSIGKPKVHSFKIEFEGKIRKNENSDWMPFESEQYNFLEKPARLFFMNAVMKHLPVAGYHKYYEGHASMDIRLLSLIKVQYMEDEKMDMAETVTFFNDMCCMAPATLIDKRIRWITDDGDSVRASFTANNITIYASLFFNDKGELINFISGDRYDADAGKKLPWSTPLKNYKNYNGYRLAENAETIYIYPEKELIYGTFHLKTVMYNPN